MGYAKPSWLHHGASWDFDEYWKIRAAKRREDELAGGVELSPPHPAMDRRLVKGGLGGGFTDLEVFKSKLWWDHLPSQRVRNRGRLRPEHTTVRRR